MAPPASSNAHGLRGPVPGTAVPSAPGPQAERRTDARAPRASCGHRSPRALGLEPRRGAHDSRAVTRGVRGSCKGMARRRRRLPPLRGVGSGSESMERISFILNGTGTTVEVDPRTPLLWVLRDHLGLTGTKFGCGMAVCGCCTVHLDGDA